MSHTTRQPPTASRIRARAPRDPAAAPAPGRPPAEPPAVLRAVGNRATAAVLQRACACSGGDDPCHCPDEETALRIQAKLAISAPGDPDELEAQRVADQVMRMQDGTGPPRANGDAGDTPAVSASALGSLGGGRGQPLDAAARAYFEPRFGADLASVRIHTGTEADASARTVHAHAFTYGRDIVFASGQYAPATAYGRRLLAHELTHVLQQRGGGVGMSAVRPHIQRDPDRPQQVIPGSTDLSRQVQAYRIDNPNVPAWANLLAVEYSVGDGPRRIRVIENRGGVAHSEPEMDEFFRNLRPQGRITVHRLYSERQPCGPSAADCEGLLLRRYPGTRVTYGYQYQQPRGTGRGRAQQTTERIEQSQRRMRESRNLEWDLPGRQPPPHHERDEPGGIPPRGGGRPPRVPRPPRPAPIPPTPSTPPLPRTPVEPVPAPPPAHVPAPEPAPAPVRTPPAPAPTRAPAAPARSAPVRTTFRGSRARDVGTGSRPATMSGPGGGRAAQIGAGLANILPAASQAFNDKSVRHAVAREMLSQWSNVQRIRRDHPQDVILFVVSLREWEFADPAGGRARAVNYVTLFHGRTQTDAEAQWGASFRSAPPRGWVEVGPFFGFIEPNQSLDDMRDEVEDQELCFIVTACYGDTEAPEVVLMRRYRDTVLRRTWAGNVAIAIYYAIAPALASFIAARPRLREWVRRGTIAPIVRLVGHRLGAEA